MQRRIARRVLEAKPSGKRATTYNPDGNNNSVWKTKMEDERNEEISRGSWKMEVVS